MKLSTGVAALILLVAAQPVIACSPPPDGWIAPPPPSPAQLRAKLVAHAIDIVYGQIEGQPGGAPVLKVYHVYKGDRTEGDKFTARGVWDHPVVMCPTPYPPGPKPVGTYGVFVTVSYFSEPIMVSGDDVQALLDEGIRSAQAR
jgi:hypothetical protein